MMENEIYLYSLNIWVILVHRAGGASVYSSPLGPIQAEARIHRVSVYTGNFKSLHER